MSPGAAALIWVALCAYAYYALVYLPDQERKELHASLEVASVGVGQSRGASVSSPSPEPARVARVERSTSDHACACPCCSNHRHLR